MKFKYQQIINIFTDLKRLKYNGIWFDSVEGEGEYKAWWENGQLLNHCFYKNNKKVGEYKVWHSNGQLYKHCFHIDDDTYRGKYKKWDNSGKLKEYKIYNKDGSLKEKIV